MKRRLLSILLAMSLLCTVLPVPALAQSGDVPGEDQTAAVQANENEEERTSPEAPAEQEEVKPPVQLESAEDSDKASDKDLLDPPEEENPSEKDPDEKDPSEEEPKDPSEEEPPKEEEPPEEEIPTGMDAFKIPDKELENPFSDVRPFDYYYTAVLAMHEMGLIKGYTETTFAPDLYLDGEQCVTLSVRIYERYHGIQIEDEDDKPQDTWYSSYMTRARKYGLLPDGKELIGPISRKQALYLLYRTLPEKELEEIRSCYRLPDVFPQDAQYEEILCLYRAGILMGNDEYGTLEGDSSVTRGQYITLLARLTHLSPRDENPMVYMTGMNAFGGEQVPTTHPFQDVPPDSFYAEDVGMLYNMGLVNGTSATTYWPEESVTLAQIATMAVRVYEIYHGLTACSEDTRPWPEGYIELARKYKILPRNWIDFEGPATRGQIAYLIYHTLPAEAIPAINSITETSDVGPSTAYYKEIIGLYNAGILIGKDNRGTFRGDEYVNRSELAAMFARLVRPSFRKKFQLARDLSGVQAAVERAVAKYSGTWSVYVSDVETGSSFSINNQRMPAASVVKLYVMGAVMEALEKGTMTNSARVQSDLRTMISNSDNEAWKRLATQLGGGSYTIGMNRVNQWCNDNGYPDSGRRLGVNPYNTTSVEDCGLFLERVLAGSNVSTAASAQMLTYLKAQQRKWKIPAGIPSGVVTANKTGELDDIENDAAIVYAATGTYVIVVLTKGGSISNIKKLSSLVYQEMMKED